MRRSPCAGLSGVYSDEDGVVSHVILCGAAELLCDVLRSGKNVSMTAETREGHRLLLRCGAKPTTRNGRDLAAQEMNINERSAGVLGLPQESPRSSCSMPSPSPSQ